MAEQRRATKGKRPASAPVPESEWERVGMTLRTIRELRGLSPETFAKAIGISRSHLVSIEMGNKKLTNVNLAIAAEVLGVEQIAIMRPDLAPVDGIAS